MASPARRDTNTSIRLWPQLRQELNARIGPTANRSDLINQFATEGMRMDAHPGITFRDGPAGRRPALFDGPDVWEVARLIREIKPRGERAVAATAKSLGLTEAQVGAAVKYYAAYREEVDAWIEMVDAESEMLEEAWRRRAEILA